MTAKYVDHYDFLSRGPYAEYVVERRSAGRFPIRMARTVQPAGDFSDPAQPDIILYLVLRSDALTTRDLGAGRTRHQFRPGEIDLQGPGVANQCIVDGHNDVIDFMIPRRAVNDVLGDERPGFDGDFGHLHAAPFYDPFLEKLCMTLWHESCAQNPAGDLFAEGLLITLLAKLSKKSSESRPCIDEDKHSLSDRTLSNIDSYIGDHLSDQVYVADLAELAGLPQHAFSRAFKLATRETPYQYITRRRLAAARRLIASDDASLAQIAYDCGFSSQSHMTTLFRRWLGVTPGRYREEFTS